MSLVAIISFVISRPVCCTTSKSQGLYVIQVNIKNFHLVTVEFILLTIYIF